MREVKKGGDVHLVIHQIAKVYVHVRSVMELRLDRVQVAQPVPGRPSHIQWPTIVVVIALSRADCALNFVW